MSMSIAALSGGLGAGSRGGTAGAGQQASSAAEVRAAARQQQLEARLTLRMTAFEAQPEVDEAEWVANFVCAVVLACANGQTRLAHAARRAARAAAPPPLEPEEQEEEEDARGQFRNANGGGGGGGGGGGRARAPAVADFDPASLRFVLVSMLSSLRHLNAHRSAAGAADDGGFVYRAVASTTATTSSSSSSSSPSSSSSSAVAAASGARKQRRVRVLARLGYNDSYYTEATERVLLDSGFGRRVLPPPPRPSDGGAIVLLDGHLAGSVNAHAQHTRKNFLFCRDTKFLPTTNNNGGVSGCLLYTSPSPRDRG